MALTSPMWRRIRRSRWTGRWTLTGAASPARPPRPKDRVHPTTLSGRASVAQPRAEPSDFPTKIIMSTQMHSHVKTCGRMIHTTLDPVSTLKSEMSRTGGKQAAQYARPRWYRDLLSYHRSHAARRPTAVGCASQPFRGLRCATHEKDGHSSAPMPSFFDDKAAPYCREPAPRQCSRSGRLRPRPMVVHASARAQPPATDPTPPPRF